MAYFFAVLHPYSQQPLQKYIDDRRKEPFFDVKLAADPDTLDLTHLERHYLAKGRSGMERGYPVKPDHAPKKMLWSCGKNPLPEVFRMQCIAVSERFRTLVEQFEPGMHQFIPVEVYKSAKSKPVATYYWFNVCCRLDSLDREKTTYALETNSDGEEWWTRIDVPDVSYADAKIVISRQKTQGHHLWYDPRLRQGWFVSAEFGRAAIEGNFVGLIMSPREEI